MHRVFGVSVLTLLLLATDCGRYFPPDINLPRYVSAQEIVGTWTLTSDTLGLAAKDGYVSAAGRPHEVVLRPDGTCDFRSITEFAHKSEYLDSRGTWKLEHDVGMPDERKRKNELSIRIGDRGISLYFTEEKGRLLLWNYWGDPDEWTLIRYEKKNGYKSPETNALPGQ